MHPNLGGREFSRSFALGGDRLTITSAGEPNMPGGTRWTWDRVPPIDNLSPLYRNVVGFWRHIVEKRVNSATLTSGAETRRSPSVIRGYVGYYGALTVHPGQVFHNILAGVSPVGGSILRRSAVINGDELTVQLPRTRNQQGGDAQTVVILKRLSGAADMLPR